MAPVREIQVHILVGCSDARDVQLVHVEAIREVRARWRERGVDARFHALRVPGSFATNEVITDVRRIVHETPIPPGTEAKYFVHIQSHGELEAWDHPRRPHAFELSVVPGSPLNCGMLGAAGAAIEIENRLFEAQPVFNLRYGKKIQIREEGDLRTLLREVYGYDGYFAGDWVKSISDLRTQARGQRAVMERAFESDPEFRRLEIFVTSGIQDYRHHRSLRTDADEIENPFWDDLNGLVYARAQAHPEAMAVQAEKQKPLAGLIAMSDVELSPRAVAAERLSEKLGYEGAFPSLFTMAGASYDVPHIPFGAYTITGTHYLIKHLGTKDIGVFGATPDQTARMMAKVEHDPLMSFLIKDGGAVLHPFSLEE